MNYLSNKLSGYTLIELLIVIIIIMSVTGFGLAGYLNFNQTQQLKQAASDIVNVLRDAQNRALAGEKDCNACEIGTCGDADDYLLSYWKAKFDSVNGTYTLSGECLVDQDGNSNSNHEYGIKVFTLTRPLQFTTSPEIHFLPITGYADNNYTITVRYGGASGPQRTITVASSGQIYE